jgi:hypothetical protein
MDTHISMPGFTALIGSTYQFSDIDFGELPSSPRVNALELLLLRLLR